MPAKNNRTGNHFHDFSNHCKSPKSRMNGGGGTHFHRTNNGSGGKQSNRSKRGYSLSPKNLPVPPPPKNSSPSSSELAEARKHLKGKHVLRKNCILSSLPRSRYPSLAHIREFFERFGKISIIVEAPATSNLWDNACKGSSVSKDDIQVFIAFHNEKMAQLALRETNDKVFGKKRNKIKSCHAHIPYCNEFLNGRSCKDINCIHLHEDLSLTSLSPVSSDFKTNFKTTTPTLLRKKKSESSTSTCVWGNTTKTFLEVTKNQCSQQVEPKQEIEVFQEARDEEVLESDEDSEDSNGFQLIETPDSTLTKSTYSSVLTCDTSFKTVESTNTIDKMELVLPPTKLFDADKEGVKMITNPFDIQSPWQLPKDGFAKLQQLPKNLTYVPKKEAEKEEVKPLVNSFGQEQNILESKKQKYKASSDYAPTTSLKGPTASIKSQRRPLSSKNQNLASPRIPNYEQLFWRNRVSSPYYYHGAAFNFHPMTINRAVPYWYHQHYPHYGANYHQQYYLWRNRPIHY